MLVIVQHWVVSQQWWGRLWKQKQAQDLIEYALMAGFVAVAVSAVFPMSIAPSFGAIMNKVNSVLVAASATG
ncbi:MAG: Flp family type IVb pilin [Acidobacteriia bacterium]|nr:Flp family type IVb pilin [Terriglobia bacterium]